jgi:hypothetical protein
MIFGLKRENRSFSQKRYGSLYDCLYDLDLKLIIYIEIFYFYLVTQSLHFL